MVLNFFFFLFTGFFFVQLFCKSANRTPIFCSRRAARDHTFQFGCRCVVDNSTVR